MIILTKGATGECLYINPLQIAKIYIEPEGWGEVTLSTGETMKFDEKTMRHILTFYADENDKEPKREG